MFVSYVYDKDAVLGFIIYKKNKNILSSHLAEITCTIRVNILQARSV
jgi:hypothetical protein